MKHRTSILRPIALTFLMALPFGFVIGFSAAGVDEGWREYKRNALGLRSWTTYHYHTLVFLNDGTPVVRDNKSVDRGRWQDVYTQMNGTPLTHDERQNIMREQWMRVDGDRRRHPFDREPFDGLLSKRNRWSGLQDPLNPSIRWAWEAVPKASTGRVLVARYQSYDVPVSFVCPEGFLPEIPESSQGFLNPGGMRKEGGVTAFHSDGKLIAINLAEKTITTISDIDPGRHAWCMFRQNDETGCRFAIRSPTTLQVYSGGGEKMFEVATSAKEFRAVALYTPTDGQIILTEVESHDQEALPGGGRLSRSTVDVSWLDETGHVTRTLQFEQEHRNERPASPSLIVNAIDQFIEFAGPGLVCSAPAVMCGAVFVLAPWISSSMFPERPASEAIQDMLNEIPYGIPVSALVALCCAIACWRRQNLYGAEWTKTWVVFVFLFGLPAWIAWRVHRRWPPLDLAGAPAAEFIGPEPNGLEIR